MVINCQYFFQYLKYNNDKILYYNVMNREQSDLIECQSCKTKVQQILTLECHHHICIQCALIYFLNNQSNKENKIYQCKFCLTKTNLSTQTIRLLQMLITAKSKIQNKKIITIYKGNNQSHKQYLNKQQVYCFSCYKILNVDSLKDDSHKNHEIKLMCRGFTKIKLVVEESQQKLMEFQERISYDKKMIQKKIQQMKQIIQQNKSQITKEFRKIKLYLQQQEENQIKKLFQFYKKTLVRLENNLQQNITYQTFITDQKNKIYAIYQEINKLDKNAFNRLIHIQNFKCDFIQNYRNIAQEYLNMKSVKFTPDPDIMKDLIERIKRFEIKIIQREEMNKFTQSNLLMNLNCKKQYITSKKNKENEFFDSLRKKIYSEGLQKLDMSHDKNFIKKSLQKSKSYLLNINKSIIGLTQRKKNECNLTLENLKKKNTWKKIEKQNQNIAKIML